MVKGSFTFSPVIGCFRRADLIQSLTEAQSNFKQGFHLKPTMMVGNDLLIWLNAIKKYRYFKYIDRALSSFGHHPESTTCDDVFNKRGMLAGIYDLTRSYFIKSHPRIIHVVSRYNPNDPKTRARVEFAAKSWNTLYSTGLVEPVHVWNTDRDSMGLGDERRTHFLKDVLKAGMDKARDFDYIMFTNDDSVLHPDLPYFLFDFMLDTDCCCAFRRAYSPGTFPPLNHRPKHPNETPGHDPGRDFFCFSKKWLTEHWEDIPDYLLGATDFDSTLGTLIRITKNIPVSDKNWLTHDPRCEIPSWFVFHENHEATWSSAHNRKFGPSNVYNRRLTYEFIKKHDNGWFVDFGRTGICETFTSNNLIPLIAHLDPCSGYGVTAVELTSALTDLGYTVDLYQGSKWDDFAKLPDKVRGCLQRGSKVPAWNFVMYPCVFQPDFLDMNMDNRTAWFSMWETTSISREGMDTGGTMIRGVSFLNRCVVAIVPCRWNAQVFQSSGVAVPIRVCPLGTDLEAFPLIENDPNQTLVFGSAARVSVGGIRKGLGIVTQAFKMAFPTEQDVRLRVKCFPDDIFDTPTDPRIELSAKVFTKPELIDWYRSINVFASGSASEGWGRHQQESMSMGRPIISINCGGVTEFFSEENGYPINHTTVTAEGVYTGMGYYFRPEVASMAAQMRRAYENRKEIVSKGLLASKSARRFSIEHSAKTLVSIFKEFKLI
jgi:glycosyltransferase involved in cell wall biosynthesis